MAAVSAIARRAFGDARVRTISFGLLFAFASVLQATAYREAYPTLAERIDFARTVGVNSATRLLYGEPRDLLTVGGYVGWRVGGSMIVFAGFWGLLGAVRAMRAEEDAGRTDLVLAGIVGRRALFFAQVAAIGLGAAVLWLAAFLGLIAGRLPPGGSAYLALVIVSSVPVFAGVGAVASQLAPRKRVATGLASGVLVAAFTVRCVADTTEGLGWLRWLSPLGWGEEMRPFTDPRPAVLALPVLTAAALLATAGALSVRRDIGSGLLKARDTAPANPRLLGSPTQLALRSERGVLIAWLLGVGIFALLMGVLSDAVSPDVVSDELQQQLEKLGTGPIVTPAGWLGFSFIFFLLAVSLFCCMQVASTREEEEAGRVEMLLALPVGRRGWLLGRLLLAAGGASAIGLSAGALAWAGATTQGADVSLLELLGAGLNTLPAALLFLSLGALAFTLVPRASAAIAYGLVGAAFVWELFGALLEVPGWLLALSPFHDVGLVPAEPFEPVGAAAMLAIALVAAFGAVQLFPRRDLT